MERVAHSLQKTALQSKTNSEEFDLFGRSSFNRYYYATFLLVRGLILEFEPEYTANHSQLPDHLCGSITREISNFRTQAQKRRDSDTVAICTRALAALQAIAATLKAAYAVRVAADYNPEIKIISSPRDRFSLIATSINEAHEWPERTRIQISLIRRAWKIVRGI